MFSIEFWLVNINKWLKKGGEIIFENAARVVAHKDKKLE